MNLYWFSQKPDGHFWTVIAAKSEELAWQRLAENQPTDHTGNVHITVEEANTRFVLNAMTSIDDSTEGKVAVCWPLECNFSIYQKPGGKLSSLSNY